MLGESSWDSERLPGRDWALPQMEITDLRSRGGTSGGTQPLGNNGFSSSVLDYNDGQFQFVANLGWTKGTTT